jgi:hypothetical protein
MNEEIVEVTVSITMSKTFPVQLPVNREEVNQTLLKNRVFLPDEILRHVSERLVPSDFEVDCAKYWNVDDIAIVEEKKNETN